jgi:hypothetical protein
MSLARRRTAARLSVLIAALMALTSGSGLFAPGLYRDNALVAAGWYGNDLVTLVVAVPLLVVALLGAWGGSRRAYLVWMGLLAYAIYNYAFYLFGAAFNVLFLVYAALLVLSAFALVFGLVGLNAEALHDRVQTALPRRRVASFLGGVAAALGSFYVALAVRYGVTGQPPSMLTATGLHTSLIAALDLTMVVPVGGLAAVWLWQGRAWGYVWAVVWSVKSAVYMLALSAATIATIVAGPADDWTQLLLWGPVGVGCAIASFVLLAHLRPD